jgi:hypothetical protein
MAELYRGGSSGWTLRQKDTSPGEKGIAFLPSIRHQRLSAELRQRRPSVRLQTDGFLNESKSIGQNRKPRRTSCLNFANHAKKVGHMQRERGGMFGGPAVKAFTQCVRIAPRQGRTLPGNKKMKKNGGQNDSTSMHGPA